MKTPSRESNRTIESLGKVTHETKPKTSNLIAGVIIGLLLLGGGLSLSVHMSRQLFLDGVHRPQTPFDWAGAIVLAVFGLALAVGGVLLFLWVKSLFSFRLCVCRDGFYYMRGGVESVFAWDEIVQVRESILHEKLPLVRDPLRQLMPCITSRSYTVVRCDGQEFYFDGNVLPRTSLLAGPLSSAATNKGFAWETTEEDG